MFTVLLTTVLTLGVKTKQILRLDPEKEIKVNLRTQHHVPGHILPVLFGGQRVREVLMEFNDAGVLKRHNICSFKYGARMLSNPEIENFDCRKIECASTIDNGPADGTDQVNFIRAAHLSSNVLVDGDLHFERIREAYEDGDKIVRINGTKIEFLGASLN